MDDSNRALRRARFHPQLWLVVLGAGCAAPDEPEGSDAPAVAWVGADTHLHAHGCGGDYTSADLLDQMEDQDLAIASVLAWGWDYEQTAIRFTSEDDPLSSPDRILRYELEVSMFPAGRMGHLNLLGLASMEFSPDLFGDPDTTLPITQWAQEQGAVIGMNHALHWPEDGSFPEAISVLDPVPWELPIHVALGRMHFFNTERAYSLPLQAPSAIYAHLRNAGFELTMTGGSDFPCLEFSGVRTLVPKEGEVTYAAYLDAIRDGRAVLSFQAGDRIDMTAEGATIGGAADVHGPVEVEIYTDLAEASDVRLFVNGELRQTLPAAAGMDHVETTLDIDGSSWLIAQTDMLQTNDITLRVAELPLRSAESACYLVQYTDYLMDLVRNGRFPGDVEVALDEYAEAREIFWQRFLDAGGTECLSPER